MTTRAIIQSAYLLLVLPLGAAGYVAWDTYQGLQHQSNLAQPDLTQVTAQDTTADNDQQSHEHRRLWTIRLQRPIYDPAPVVNTVRTTPPPPLKVSVLGISKEGDAYQAMLQDAKGNVYFVKTGDSLNQPAIEVKQIDAQQITVIYQNKPVTLKLGSGGRP